MSTDDLDSKRNRITFLFNLIASLMVLGVGVFLLIASYSGWFGARSSRMSLLAWLVVAYGVIRFFLYYLRKRRAASDA
jgi:divalent metal cation (Fe/Co/Zn/Cd) transporter